VELHQLVAESIADTKASLWPAFGPELILCATILVMLLVKLIPGLRKLDAFLIVLIGSLAALYFAFPLKHFGSSDPLPRCELFTGMLVYDAFTVYMRAFLVFFAVLFALFTRISGIPDRADAVDFYCMVLGAIVGMCLMVSANHLLVVFLAVEMASVPSYALAAMLKGRRESSEAALKYSIYGAGAAGVMLYGISLLAGILGSAHFPTMAAELSQRLPELSPQETMVLVLGGLMTTVGLAFKLSAVPFHFWCPDVFEGASAEVNAFLSVASKGAALALLVRVSLGLGMTHAEVAGPPTPEIQTQHAISTASGALAAPEAALMAVADESLVSSDADHVDTFTFRDSGTDVRHFIGLVIALLAAVTCTFGNLAAYGQTNIKRLLAYSTIAHAGYMMLPIPAALELAGVDPPAAKAAIASLALYMGIYLFMNLGAFAIVAFLRNTLGSEEIADYSGLVRQSPGVAICLATILFSLVGIPPLAGFVGKFAIFASLAEGYVSTGQVYLIVLLILGGLNTVISLFYYLRVIKVMTFESGEDRAPATPYRMLSSLAGLYTALVTAPLILLFVSWESLNNWTQAAMQNLF